MKYYLLVLLVVGLIFFKLMDAAWLILTGIFFAFLVWFNISINSKNARPKPKGRP